MKSLRVNGYALSYVEAGQGRPLLMLHGSLCDCRFWQPQMAAFGAFSHAIAPSLRGCWPEVWDGRGEGYSIDQHVEDMVAFIEQLGVGPVDLLGHSRGGLVACRLALAAPQSVRRLILAEPGGVPDEALSPELAPIARLQAERVAEAARLIESGDIEGGLARFVDGVSGGPVWAQMVPGFKRMARDNAQTLIAQARETRQRFSRTELHAITQPTLLIGGARSPAAFAAVLDLLQRELPQSRRETIVGASHAMNLAAPKTFNAVVTTFLAMD